MTEPKKPEKWSEEWIDALVMDVVLTASNDCGCYESGCTHDFRKFARAVAREAFTEAAETIVQTCCGGGCPGECDSICHALAYKIRARSKEVAGE